MIGYFYICTVIVTVFVVLLTYFKWKFLHWRNKEIPYIEPRFPFGTNENPFKRQVNRAIWFQRQYHHFKSLGCRYGGLYLFLRPGFLVVDTRFIRNVMSKDFRYFTDRGLYHNETDDPLSANLFNLEGEKWKNLRAKLTPTFTSGKIKNMFATLVASGNPLYAAVIDYCHKKEPIDAKDLSARFTTDVIGSCAFGLECNSFTEPESDFRKYGKMFFSALSKFQLIKFIFASSNPTLSKRLGITISDPLPKNFFLNIVKETLRYRKQNNIARNDFMQLLMNLMDDESEPGLTVEQVAAQAFVFFIAGFETSSTTMTFCLCELAVNQQIQERVRDEINSTLSKYKGNITYEAMMEMKYLNNVIEETLRKYPPFSFLFRVCVKNYKIPGTNTNIEKGTRVIIPVYGLHHDPEYFPDPENFNPDRFNEENRSKIVPFTYIPFGEGPRICIASRFGLLQTKVGLVILLRNFIFRLNAKTKFPIEYDRSSFTLTAKTGIWLDIEKVI